MFIKQLVFVLLSLLLSATSVLAFSNCQVKYDSDKRSIPSLRGMCNVCHLSPSGSGPQNEFGRAFANAGFKITDKLVTDFPQFFQKPQEAATPTPSPTVSSPVKPVIKRIKPKSVKINVQSMISVMGQNFVSGAKAFIDNNEVITTFKTNMLLVIDFVLNTIGLHDLKVQNPDGEESNTVKIMSRQ